MVAPRQRPADRLQRRGLALFGFHPVGKLRGCRFLARGQERRHRQRHNRRGLLSRLKLFERDLPQPQRFVGKTRQFVSALCRCPPRESRRSPTSSVIVLDPHATDVRARRLDRPLPRRPVRARVPSRRRRGAAPRAAPDARSRRQSRSPDTPGDRVAAVARPVGNGVGDFQMHGIEVDVRVGPGVVDRGRQLVVLQREHHLRQAGRAGRRFQVSHIGFHRTQQCRLVGGAALPDDAAQRLGLDRVAEDGAGAVRLDVVDGARVDARVLVGRRSTSACASGFGASRPLERPSWLTALPAITARIWSPSRRASSTRLSTSMPPPSERA